MNAVPLALSSSLARNQTLRDFIIILKIAQDDQPHIDEQHQATIHPLGRGFWQVVLHYGFMQQPNVAADLRKHMKRHAEIDLDNLTFFVGRSIFVEGPHSLKPQWRKNLFLWLANNIEEEFDYSRMPSEQMIQIGTQIEV